MTNFEFPTQYYQPFANVKETTNITKINLAPTRNIQN